MLYDDLFLEEVIDHSYDGSDFVYEEEIEYNPNTYSATLLEALTKKQKKLLKIGAAVAGATALGAGGYKGYKYYQGRKQQGADQLKNNTEDPKSNEQQDQGDPPPFPYIPDEDDSD